MDLNSSRRGWAGRLSNSEMQCWEDSEWASRSQLPKANSQIWSLSREVRHVSKENHVNGSVIVNPATARRSGQQYDVSNLRHVITNITLLCDSNKYEECAHLINTLSHPVLTKMLSLMPLDAILECLPTSMCILEALYSKLFIGNTEHFPVEEAKVEKVMNAICNWFSKLEDSSFIMRPQSELVHYMPMCKNILRIIMFIEPKYKRKLERRSASLRRCIDRMSFHGLVATSERKMLKLHDALKSELEKTVFHYKQAIHALEESKPRNSSSSRSNISSYQGISTESHQRLMQMTQAEIHQRLFNNKSLLNVIELGHTNSYLKSYIEDLRERITYDKDVVLNFNELHSENKELSENNLVTPVFQKYVKACTNLVDLLNEVSHGQHRNSDYLDESNLKDRCPGSDKSSSSLNKSVHEEIDSVSDTHSVRSSSNNVPQHPASTCSSPVNQKELQLLRDEVQTLRAELLKSHETIQHLKDREKYLRNRLSEQAQKQLEKGSKFEDLNLGEYRPTQLIRRYGTLYSQMRLDVFDALDNLPEMEGFDDLKGKLLFSIVVLSYRSVQQHLRQLRTQIQRLLYMSSDMEVQLNIPVDPLTKQLEESITLYLRKTVDKCDLTSNVKDVSEQVWNTLYDYPSLKKCPVLCEYIEECTRLCWAFCIQTPALYLHYEPKVFNSEYHNRFHSSNPDSTEIQGVLWPTLLEGENGPCLYKGVVIT